MEGKPCWVAPAPAPPGLIGFVSGPARGCQLSSGAEPGREARPRGRGGARGFAATPLFALLATELFWVCSPKVQIFGNSLAWSEAVEVAFLGHEVRRLCLGPEG